MKPKRTFLCALLLPLGACGEPAAGSYDTAEYDRQSRKYWEQAAETDRQSETAARQLEVAEQQAERFQALLEKWEEQAIRQDRILAEQERRLGIEGEAQQDDAGGTP